MKSNVDSLQETVQKLSGFELIFELIPLIAWYVNTEALNILNYW